MYLTKRWLLTAAALLKASSALVVPTAPQTQRANSVTTQLNAVTVMSEPDQSFRITPIRPNTEGAGWHRKLVKKVFRRGDREQQAMPRETSSNEAPTATQADAFVLKDYETLTPSQVLPLELSETKQAENVPTQFVTVDDVVQPPKHERRKARSSSPPLARVTGGKAETTLATLMHRWTKGTHTNLRVHCDPNSGVVDMVKGLFRADAKISFDQIGFGSIQMSKGMLQSHRMALNLYKYAPFGKRIPRFASAFDLEAHDVIFTQDDLFESKCIRHGLRQLLTRVLKNRGMKASKVGVTSIKILPNGKLSVSGYATSVFESKVEFEVRSGLGVKGRGHVLTFPGLEISVGPAKGLFVPVMPPLSLDMGNNAKITKLSTRNGKLKLSCRTTITPRHTRKLTEYHQSTNAYAASFHFDVGDWLTRIGRFSD